MPIFEPTLLLDTKKSLRNIQRMAEKANNHNILLRPHFKTHQSREIGGWFRSYGVDRITVSSLKMAEYFAEDGWQDITVAFPVNIRELERINRLAAKIKLNLLVESVLVVEKMQKYLKSPVAVFIKIDTGYHRTGLLPDAYESIKAVIQKIDEASLLTFAGFLTHAGHSYAVSDIQGIETIHNASLRVLKQLKIRYQDRFPNLILSVGDTPTCSLMDSFEPADEIRPGTFVFYDLAQFKLGVCELTDIAIAMACPVVAKHPGRNEIVFYGGSAHFSKDFFLNSDNQKIFGYYTTMNTDCWDIPEGCCYVKSLSQEHGVLHTCDKHFSQIQIGGLVHILPVHSCLTGNLMKSYQTLDGKHISRL